MARKPVKRRTPRNPVTDPKFNLTVGSDLDPFWVDPSTVPDGVSLQWTSKHRLPKGWRLVPAAPVGGQYLTWAPHEVARAQRDAQVKRAFDQMEAFGIDRSGKTTRILSGSFMCSSAYDWADPSVKFLDVDVAVSLRLSYRQLDAASAFGLTPKEYGERLVKMLRISPIGQHGLVYGLPEFFNDDEEK